MNFAEHLLLYYKGEWLEATLLSIFGLVAGCVAFAIWQPSAHNALLKGLFYPIACLAALTFFTGCFGVYNNSQRLQVLPAQFVQTPAVLVNAEIQRFESSGGVNAWWLPLKALWTILLFLGVAVSFTTRSDFVQGLAIGIIVVGAMGFVIDGFAHHRAKVYTAALKIERALHP